MVQQPPEVAATMNLAATKPRPKNRQTGEMEIPMEVMAVMSQLHSLNLKIRAF